MTTMTKPETVEAMKDAASRFTEAQALEIGNHFLAEADRMKRERQMDARKEADAEVAAAFERARALCEKHGIPFTPDLGKKGKGKTQSKKPAGVKLAVFQAHHRYEHPNDSTKFWTGVGVQPNWVKELVSAGKMPIDRGAVKAA